MTPNDVPRSSGKRPSSSRGYFRRRTGQGARLPGRAGRVRATQTGVESVSHNIDRRLLGTNGDSLPSRAPRAAVQRVAVAVAGSAGELQVDHRVTGELLACAGGGHGAPV